METDIDGELLEAHTEFVVTVVQYEPGVDGPPKQGEVWTAPDPGTEVIQVTGGARRYPTQ